MPIDITALDQLGPDAIRHFWKSRLSAGKQQEDRGISDQGNRSQVTSGKNLDGFIKLTRQLILDNGIKEIDLHYESRNKGKKPNIPGYYRPKKDWDILVVSKGRLLAAI